MFKPRVAGSSTTRCPERKAVSVLARRRQLSLARKLAPALLVRPANANAELSFIANDSLNMRRKDDAVVFREPVL